MLRRPRPASSLLRTLARLGAAGVVSLALAGCKPAPAESIAPASSASPATSEVTVSLATVILVRHGEKATDDPRDPSLSPAGEARAQALAALLARAGVTHLFASEYRRTQATLRPLAQATGLETVAIPAADVPQLIAAIRALPAGAVAVVAGHSNTVPAIVDALGGQVRDTAESGGQRVLPDDAYDRLFVVTWPREPASGATQTLELRYGQSSAGS